MPLIEIENVSKRYGSVRALENVSLRMEGSGIMGLLGQNGAGKTTLINILTGYLAPTSGRALLGGHDPLMEPGEAKRHLGYLPEQPPLSRPPPAVRPRALPPRPRRRWRPGGSSATCPSSRPCTTR